jgi:hypothetical protein
MPNVDKPLTTLLLGLAHSPDLLAEFNSDRATVLERWGLTEHELFQADLTLERVQAAVAEEFGGEVQVAWWIWFPDWVWGFSEAE